ncbi:hypothetical protein ACHHYP_15004 [Achlya hypogyna]|uniref:RING-type E3 ubiquitin transferase n=1 Tax=Achlya hypogyna TaxID=1202772 RepID=A0A1V9YBT1_ACHHY|nr:hypothetical protein ACHHYP_15004 [Achlya hypogyna]
MPPIELHDDEVTCAICLDIFSSPITLPCGHTFDRACFVEVATRTAKDDSSIPCPVCRLPISRTIVATLRINSLVDTLVQRAFPLAHARRRRTSNEERYAPVYLPTADAPPLAKMSGFLFACYALVFCMNAAFIRHTYLTSR